MDETELAQLEKIGFENRDLSQLMSFSAKLFSMSSNARKKNEKINVEYVYECQKLLKKTLIEQIMPTVLDKAEF